MGLAPYGEPKYLNELEKLIYFEGEKLLLNKEFFNIHQGYIQQASHPENLGKFYSNKLTSLFGQPRLRG